MVLGARGEWVMFARYAGSRIKIEGGEIRLLNDDEVLATIKNPEDILHELLNIEGVNYAKEEKWLILTLQVKALRLI